MIFAAYCLLPLNMTDFLLKLFGIRATGSGRITDTAVNMHGVNPTYVFIAVVLVCAAVVWMYRRTGESLSPLRRWTLTLLRCLFLVLILGLLLRPVLTVAFEHSIRRTLLVLIDSSASMSQIKDQRSDEADLKRVAIARNLMDPATGLKGNLPTTGREALANVNRLEVVRAAFKNDRLDLLHRLSRDYDLAAYTFAHKEDVAEIPSAAYALKENEKGSSPEDAPPLNTAWVSQLKAEGTTTAIGDSLRAVISRKRGQPLAGVLLVTDGASNAGQQPLEAATLAGKDRVPLWIYGVGITSPRDIVVGNIFAQEVAFVKDEVPVSVRVRSMGLSGQSAKLQVTLGEQRVEKEVEFSADGEQVVTVTLTPRTAGEFDIQAAVPGIEGEVTVENNKATPQRIRVIDDKIKVLYVEQYPRWEFKYVQAVLARDRRIDAKFFLVEGDPSISRGANTPYLSEFPTKKEDLFRYDLIILGDLDPKLLSITQFDMLNDFVSKFGGALVMVAGKRSAPSAYRKTIIEKMLPIEMETLDIATPGATANKPVKLELTPAGKATPMLRIAERELESATKWATMPPVYWVQKVARAKPAAEVLVVDPDPAKASRYGKMPVIAMQQYGLGQVLYIGTDNLWRWRKNAGDRFHATLWGQIIQRMALPHLLGASKRTQLSTDQKKYGATQNITVYARLYSETFEPITEPTVNASVIAQSPDAKATQETLRAMPGQPGMYSGTFTIAQAGNYEFTVDNDKSVKLEFAVEEVNQELAETAMNATLLKQMAASSGGEFFREEDLATLPEKMTGKQDKVKSKLEVDLWSSPFYFLAMLLVVSSEWVLRKMSQLK